MRRHIWNKFGSSGTEVARGAEAPGGRGCTVGIISDEPINITITAKIPIKVGHLGLVGELISIQAGRMRDRLRQC